jgi:Tol biopolymer transport system component
MKDARAVTGRGDQRLAAVVLAVVALLVGRPCAAQLAPRVIELLSQTARGMSAEGRSEAPAVNQDGLAAAYSSNALDLVSPPFTNAISQMYARDLEMITSELVSKASNGRGGNQPSQASGFPAGISADGRYVTFSSSASNLVGDDLLGLENVFVYDRVAGALELITRGTDGPANGASNFAKISGDGRYVVFQSIASNLVDGDDNGLAHIYVFDRTDGVMVLVSVGVDGATDGPSITPNISEDGRVVAFASRATNLVTPSTSGAFEQIFATDWHAETTELVSLSSAGQAGNALSFLPALNRDGTQVAFKSEAFNLVPNDTNGVPDVFVRDRPAETTERVSVDSFGNQSNGLSGGPGISGDARFVAFASFASNFVPDDSNGQSDVYVYDRFPPDRMQGIIARVTVGIDGEQPNNGVSDFPVTVSGDGRWIGFASAASNLVPNDLNNDQDAFLACNPFDEFECAPPTPVPTATATATATDTPGMPACVGDCDGDGVVTVADLVRMVNIALGLQPICPNDMTGGCLAGDANCDCEITVDEIIRAVQNSLQGCFDFGDCSPEQHEQLCCEGPIGTPTNTRTITPTPPVTPTPTVTMPGGLCVGDCEDSGGVSIAELIRMVSIALGLQGICPNGGLGCLAGDANCDCEITVDEIIQAVNNALFGCTYFNTCDPIEHEEMCCGS